jgi:hypothetical protein
LMDGSGRSSIEMAKMLILESASGSVGDTRALTGQNLLDRIGRLACNGYAPTYLGEIHVRAEPNL